MNRRAISVLIQLPMSLFLRLTLRRFDLKYGLDHDRCANGRAVHTVHDADVSRLSAKKLDKKVRGTVGHGGVLNKFIRRQYENGELHQLSESV